MKKPIRILLLLLPILVIVAMCVNVQKNFFENENKTNLIINEIMAKNIGGICDENGNYVDWIELYNGCKQDIELSGYGLSDSKSDLYRYTFPKTKIKSGEYLLVFATDTQSSNFSCGFCLESGGETIYLTNPEGKIVDSLSFPKQKYNISYGRSSLNCNALEFFQRPTPGSKNSLYGTVERQISEKTEISFSLESGFYNEDQQLEITSSNPEATILYSLDGSTPSLKSHIYKNPIPLKHTDNYTTIVVRACLYENNLLSDYKTRTYYIGEYNREIPMVNLVLDPDDMFSNDRGIYVSGALGNTVKTYGYYQPFIGNYMLDDLIEGDIFVFDQKQVFCSSISLRMRGGSSRAFLVQKSFSFMLDEPICFNGKNHSSLKLRSSGGGEIYNQCKVDSFVESACKDLDIGASNPQLCNLFINGEYWGIYSMMENDDAQYWKTEYNIDEKDLICISYDCDMLTYWENPTNYAMLERGKEEDYNDYCSLYKWILSSDFTTNETINELSQWVDIDNFTNQMIAEMCFDNKDWPKHNLKIWKTSTVKNTNKYSDGRWRWKIYDMDFCLDPNTVLENPIQRCLKIQTDESDPVYLTIVLFQKLWENKDYKSYFSTKLNKIVNKDFCEESLLAIFDKNRLLQEKDIEKSIDKGNYALNQVYSPIIQYYYKLRNYLGKTDFYSVAAWNDNNDKLRTTILKRCEYLSELSQELCLNVSG